MKTKRSFDPEGTRYAFDFGLCKASEGWAQVDTRQDAWYFGMWTNPATRQIVSYCEGDISVEESETDEEYVQALRAMHQWNVDGGYWKGIDTMMNPSIKAAFERLGVEDLFHASDRAADADIRVHPSATLRHRFEGRTEAGRQWARARSAGG